MVHWTVGVCAGALVVALVGVPALESAVSPQSRAPAAEPSGTPSGSNRPTGERESGRCRDDDGGGKAAGGRYGPPPWVRGPRSSAGPQSGSTWSGLTPEQRADLATRSAAPTRGPLPTYQAR